MKRVASMGRAARAKAGIKVRQPLTEVLVRPRDANEAAVLARQEALLLEELNVKALNTLEDEAGIVTFEVKPNLPVLGPRLGARSARCAPRLARSMPERWPPPSVPARTSRSQATTLPPMTSSSRCASATATRWSARPATPSALPRRSRTSSRTRASRVNSCGTSRTLRREADFELSDRITAWCAGGETVARVLAAHGDYVKGETLSVELHTEAPPEDAQQTRFTLDGIEVIAGVRRRDA